MTIVTPSFSKSSVFKMFSVHTKIKKPAFSNSSGLKSVYEKLRFRDGLVWTVGLTVETSRNKAVFSNSSGEVWTAL